MLLHDRITLVHEQDGYRDDRGMWVPGERVEVILPAEVEPINSDTVLGQTPHVVTRFRITLHPIQYTLNTQTEIHWEGRRMQIEGRPEHHRLQGRPHHLEIVAAEYTGG